MRYGLAMILVTILSGSHAASARPSDSTVQMMVQYVGEIATEATSPTVPVDHFFEPTPHMPSRDVQQRLAMWKARPGDTSRSPAASDVVNRVVVNNGVELIASTINPPDNAMAVNGDGTMVLAINSRVLFADVQGRILFQRGLESFFSAAINGPFRAQFFCDPRVVFDQFSQRFILTAMTCLGNSASSQLGIAISKTSNPSDGWWLYQLNGNQSDLLSTNTWIDFPNVTVSETDVYVAANLFTDNGTYRQAFVATMRKQPMLDGTQLQPTDVQRFLRLSGEPYALFPVVRRPNDGLESVVMISNGIGNDVSEGIDVYEFKRINDAPIQVERTTIRVPAFEPPSFSAQPGSTVILSCFDQRGAGSVVRNGTVTYVYSVRGQQGAAVEVVQLGRVNGRWTATRSRRLERPSSNMTYPSIALMDPQDNASEMVLAYTYASGTEAPGIASRTLDTALRSSEELLIRPGDGPVEFQSSYDFSRWADYTAAVTDISSSTPGVWVFAPYGARNGVWNNYLARIARNGGVSVTNGRGAVGWQERVYPNPSADDAVSIEIVAEDIEAMSVEVVSLDATVRREVYRGTLREGRNVLTCSLSDLPQGMYGIVIRTPSMVRSTPFVRVSGGQ